MFSYRAFNVYGFLLCVFAMLFAVLYLERTLYLDPCPLCVMDRAVIIGIAVLFFIALIFNPKSTMKIILGILTSILCVIGIGFASRHIWLQNLPKDQVPECGPDIYYMLDTLPLFDVLGKVLTGSGSCADISWTFMGLTIPEQTLILFLGLLVLALIQTFRTNKSF